METSEFLQLMPEGHPSNSKEMHDVMIREGERTRRLTAKLNNDYHSPEEVRELMSEIIRQPLDEGFSLFPPFTSDFGANIHIGKGVFINSGARFQDQGGIFIGDGCFLGHNILITALNHDLNPETRFITKPAPVRLGKGVWAGANVTILPGVTVGDDAVLGAGAVVTKDVPARAIVAGVPARVIKTIDD